ncbi:MAG: response regulator [Verrucomicrobiia bacterium]
MAAREVATTLLPSQTRPPQRLLVVEDDISIRQLSTEFLSHSGYEVDAAEDGAAAWEALGTESYDLMITDNEMPNLTGIELLEKLYAIHMNLPVIMASGTMPDEEFALCPWLQPAATLLKPYTFKKLLGTVESVMRESYSPGEVINRVKPQPAKDKIISQAEAPPVHRLYLSNPPSRILVVDDDSDVRQLSVDVLADSGYEVEGVKDGAAGWEALQASSYDLVITDNKMPRMTGMEMIEKLRAASMSLPVILATSYLPRHELAHKPWLKPDAMLQRPFSTDDLLKTVKEVLGPDDRNEGSKEAPVPQHH